MTRQEFFKNLLKDVSGAYVEVGTCWGGFADFLLSECPLERLFCVDPYKVFPSDVYQDTLNNQSQQDLDKKYLIVEKRLKEHPRQKPVQMLRLTSYAAAHLIRDQTMSFVYIDGNHAYNEVLKDLICWWPKIRKGGYLCGDDVEDLYLPHLEGNFKITHATGAYGMYGVATALRDFQKVCPEFQYQIHGNQFYAKK
jgi:cephalosporin hydroxylase